MRGKEPGRAAIAFGSSPEGALFFRFPYFFWRICCHEKMGDFRRESAEKGGASFLRITLIFAVAPPPSTLTATMTTTMTMATNRKRGPLFDQLSRSRSKFPRRRSSPTPTYCQPQFNTTLFRPQTKFSLSLPPLPRLCYHVLL